MAANDWRTGTYAIDSQGRGNFNKQAEGLRGQEFTIVRYLDASTVNMTSGDSYKLFTFDAGVMVNGLWVAIGTAEGGAATIDVGDSGSATRFSNDLDVNATAGTVTATTTQSYYYAAADYLSILINNALDAAKFWVVARCIRLT